MQRIIDLKEKRVIVTGAGSGIGRETVRMLCREGAIVTAVDINGEGLVGTAADCGGACHTVTIDMTDATAVSEAVSQAVTEYGKLDGIVHCAGISSRKPLNVLSKDGFSKVMDVNFYSFVELVKQCAKKKHINDGASIVVMSSISSICGYKAKTEYCVSKAAVDAFVRCMALELADRHIRVNSVMPVGVDTPMGRKAVEMAAVAGNDSVANEPLVQPMEIANTIAFLLSDAAPSISGAAIPIMMPQQSATTPPTTTYM